MPNTIDSAGSPLRGPVPVDVVPTPRGAPTTGSAPVQDTPAVTTPTDGARYNPRPPVQPVEAYDARGRLLQATQATARSATGEDPKMKLVDPLAPHTMWERLKIQGQQLLHQDR
jgi:hypothetical protein